MIDSGVLLGFGLYLARCSTFVLAAPMYGSASGYSGYKVGMIATLTLVFFGLRGEPFVLDGPPLEYLLLAFREALIGFFLAFVFQAVILALRVAGELIGQGMGLNISSQVDPVSGINTPLITRLYEAMFYIGFLSLDGHHGLLMALGRTFERAPIGEADFDMPLTEFVGELFAQLFNAGLTFAAPVLVVLTLVALPAHAVALGAGAGTAWGLAAAAVAGFANMAMLPPLFIYLAVANAPKIIQTARGRQEHFKRTPKKEH